MLVLSSKTDPPSVYTSILPWSDLSNIQMDARLKQYIIHPFAIIFFFFSHLSLSFFFFKRRAIVCLWKRPMPTALYTPRCHAGIWVLVFPCLVKFKVYYLIKTIYKKGEDFFARCCRYHDERKTKQNDFDSITKWIINEKNRNESTQLYIHVVSRSMMSKLFKKCHYHWSQGYCHCYLLTLEGKMEGTSSNMRRWWRAQYLPVMWAISILACKHVDWQLMWRVFRWAERARAVSNNPFKVT